MSLAAEEPELSANGTTASRYRDGVRPVRVDLRPAEPILGPISTNPDSTISASAISVLVNIRKR